MLRQFVRFRSKPIYKLLNSKWLLLANFAKESILWHARSLKVLCISGIISTDLLQYPRVHKLYFCSYRRRQDGCLNSSGPSSSDTTIANSCRTEKQDSNKHYDSKQ